MRKPMLAVSWALPLLALSAEASRALAQPKLLVTLGQEAGPSKRRGISVYCVAFSPDGKTVAAGTNRREVQLWDVVTGKETATLPGHEGAVRSVAFRPDGKALVSGDSSGALWLWDLTSNSRIARLNAANDSIRSVNISPDGKTVAASRGKGIIGVWDLGSAKLLKTLEGGTDGSAGVTSVAFSPDSKLLASAHSDLKVRLWDAATGKCLATLEGHKDDVEVVAFSPDGKRLATGSYDHTVRLWDMQTRKNITTLDTGGVVRTLAFSPDGKALASGGWSYHWAFSPDGKALDPSGMIEVRDNSITLWDLATGGHTARLEGHGDGILSVAFSPDSMLLASGSEDGTVKLWDLAPAPAPAQQAKKLASLPTDFTAPVKVSLIGRTTTGLLFSPSGKTAITRRYEEGERHNGATPPDEFSDRRTGKTLRGIGISFWDTVTWKELHLVKASVGPLCDAVFSEDGKALAFSTADDRVIIWDTEAKKEITSFKTKLGWHGNLLAFSQNRKQLAVWHGRDFVYDRGTDQPPREEPAKLVLWDLESGRPASVTTQFDALPLEVIAHTGGKSLKSLEGNARWSAIFDEKQKPELGFSSAQSFDEETDEAIYAKDGKVSALVEWEEDPRPGWGLSFRKPGRPTERIVVSKPRGETILNHRARVQALAISSDGKRLASGDGEDVKIWDVATEKMIGTIRTDAGPGLAFAPDGKVLFVGREVWDLSPLLKESPRK
jgi:WD40 repeat protein